MHYDLLSTLVTLVSQPENFIFKGFVSTKLSSKETQIKTEYLYNDLKILFKLYSIEDFTYDIFKRSLLKKYIYRILYSIYSLILNLMLATCPCF